VAKVIEDRRLMAEGSKKGGDCPADITGTAGNQSSHKNTVLP
jgi:hypothetical protein